MLAKRVLIVLAATVFVFLLARAVVSVVGGVLEGDFALLVVGLIFIPIQVALMTWLWRSWRSVGAESE